MVFDHVIGMNYVAPYLISPARLDALTLYFCLFLGLLLQLHLQYALVQYPHGHFFVPQLRALALAHRYNAGWHVRYADRAARLLHVLATRTAGPVRLDFQVRGRYLDIYIFLSLGHDLYQGKGGMTGMVIVKRRQSHQPVHSVLRRQIPVGMVPFDLNDCTLYPGLGTHRGVKYLGTVAVPLRPAQVHAQHHLSPVLRLGPARAGMDGENGVMRVKLALEKETEFQLIESLINIRCLPAHFLP